MPDVVYVVGPEKSQTVKIGFSNRAHHRLRQIQSMSPLRLDLLWSIAGDKNLEGVLHDRFRSYRSHGEWFAFPAALDPVRCVENVVDALQYARTEDGTYPIWSDAPMCGPEHRRYWLNRRIREHFYRRQFTLPQVADEAGLSVHFVEKYGAELIAAGDLLTCGDGSSLMTTWDPEERYDLLGPMPAERISAME